MMIVSQLEEIQSQPLFYTLSDFVPGAKTHLKLEGLNIAGSIKLKTAKYLLDDLEAKGQLIKGQSKIIESSSGNLAIALALLCKDRGYSFTAVIDPNILKSKEKLLKIYGANLIKVKQKDSAGGYLATRINCIQSILDRDSDYIWTNQYANPANLKAHYELTAKEIFSHFEKVDYLFVGAGTTGTLMGCATYCNQFHSETQLIAVDAYGSVSFDKPSAKRLIPGLGTSRKPELLNTSVIQEILWITEADTIQACHSVLSQYGLLIGGSTGSVLSGVQQYFADKTPTKNATIVTISPDFGTGYIDTVFSDEWVERHFTPEIINE